MYHIPIQTCKNYSVIMSQQTKTYIKEKRHKCQQADLMNLYAYSSLNGVDEYLLAKIICP